MYNFYQKDIIWLRGLDLHQHFLAYETSEILFSQPRKFIILYLFELCQGISLTKRLFLNLWTLFNNILFTK